VTAGITGGDPLKGALLGGTSAAIGQAFNAGDAAFAAADAANLAAQGISASQISATITQTYGQGTALAVELATMSGLKPATVATALSGAAKGGLGVLASGDFDFGTMIEEAAKGLLAGGASAEAGAAVKEATGSNALSNAAAGGVYTGIKTGDVTTGIGSGLVSGGLLDLGLDKDIASIAGNITGGLINADKAKDAIKDASSSGTTSGTTGSIIPDVSPLNTYTGANYLATRYRNLRNTTRR